ncbi:NAD(P)/FAD-dependent oxidoreductase [Auritidibacter ignavus]|uniref:NAD(P)/FAD-dependent oxidoreductase n=1 Tax=Auritidibacter ignavus TaxID=678932 RepID=UPI00109CEE50|nr:FAD-binding oxidoreductase [Auritidibacter ignavus]
MQVIVIGAGIVGLATATKLAEAGHQVQLLDREGVFAGASHRSFAWINANHKLPESYHQLNTAGIHAHAEFQRSVLADRRARGGDEEPWFHHTGSILADFGDSQHESYRQRYHESRELGYPVEMIDRCRLQELEPGVVWPQGLEHALYFPQEGWLDQHGLADQLRRRLAHHGTKVAVREVVEVMPGSQGARVVFNDGSTAEADKVVVAAGAWSREIAEQSGLRIPTVDLGEHSPRVYSLLGLTQPTHANLSRVLVTSRMNVRPRNDGRLWVQVPQMDARVAEGETPELLEETESVMRQRLAEFFDRDITLEKLYYSGRSFPVDGLSIVGYVDEYETVYANVTHSGMTLSMILAELVTHELAGSPSPMLEDFRPQRFESEDIQDADLDYFIGRQ